MAKQKIAFSKFLKDLYKYNPDFKDDVEEESLGHALAFILIDDCAEEFLPGFPYKLIDSYDEDADDDDINRTGIFQRLADGKCFALCVNSNINVGDWDICTHLQEVTQQTTTSTTWK